MGTVTLTGDYVAGNYAVSEGDPSLKNDLDLIVAELNGNVEAVNISNGAITTTKLADDSVDSAKLKDDAVLETHMDYTLASSGVLAVQCGPSYTGASGLRIARVSKDVTYDGTASPQTVTFTFATDCVDGNPAFSAAPTLLGPPVVVDSTSASINDSITHVYVTSLTSSLVTMDVYYVNAGGNLATTVTMQFGVAGPV